MSALSVEDIKRSSHALRGTLADSLADASTGAIADADQVVIKFHGSYQQDDRDLREERRRAKLEPDYQFMIRTRTPGGVVSPRQWRQLDAIAQQYGNRTLRITTRQAFQFHGVVKGELKSTMQAINASLIDTLAACGDVNRNVMVAANPLQSALHAQVHADAARLSEHLLPNTRAYYELWLDEKQVGGGEDEPLYGPTYLPRKFKIAFAVPPLNDVDVFAHDLGFIAIPTLEAGAEKLATEVAPTGAVPTTAAASVAGYNISVGGGMGATHGDAETYPLLAQLLGFVRPEQVLALAEAVLTTQRDFGNRAVRKRARLKYTIEDRGLDWFRAEVERRAGFALGPARPFSFEHSGDRYGWVDGDDDRAHLTLQVPAGRIADTRDASWASGMRAIANVHRGEFRLTPNQNLVIAGVPAGERRRIDALVRLHRLDDWRRGSALRRQALACVAMPTCGLAMAEAERYLPDFVALLEPLLAAHGLSDAPILLRLSGCPNGCSRPYLGEIALVGKAPGRYNLMLGADARGQRLNTLYRENVDEGQILEALEPLLARYGAERAADEGFGDFLIRSGVIAAPRPIPACIALVETAA
jgi:sulfite reductase (NADPH) hemoprotein beta-component